MLIQYKQEKCQLLDYRLKQQNKQSDAIFYLICSKSKVILYLTFWEHFQRIKYHILQTDPIGPTCTPVVLHMSPNTKNKGNILDLVIILFRSCHFFQLSVYCYNLNICLFLYRFYYCSCHFNLEYAI